MVTKYATKQIQNEIIELSKTKSEKEIAEIYGRTQSGIHLILKKNGITKLKKSRLNMSHLALNINYFSLIDSPDKAYWLGFICADGNVNKSNNKVSLISKDVEVIEGFKNAISAEHKISKREVFDKRTNKTYTGYSIQIGNELFTRNLINLGVTSNKTNELKFPEMESKYYRYFIAGLFDGDGSVFWKGKNKNRLEVNIISTYEVLLHIQKYLQNELNISPKYICRVTKNKSNVWKMYLYSDAYKFLNFIYGDKLFEYYLKRKYNKYVENIDNRGNVRHFKKVYQYDKNMNLIKIWNSQDEISKHFNVNKAAINKYLRNGNKRGYYKNYIWKYEE